MSKIVLVSLVMVMSTKQEEVITVQGRVRGEGRDGIISFKGIPYASVQANGRFKQGGIAPVWPGVRESQPNRCAASTKIDDCLQLDVHVPTSGDAPWPVLVWIKGGPGYYDPWKLVQKGIIAVTVNHRIGPAGFLCTKEEQIPGNAGVKDVVLALRWVRDNIGAFRGNPHRVVIAGQGFGAAIVEALVLSPMAQGLFHGAIQQSGSILCPWSFNYDAKERGQYLSDMIGKRNGDNSDLIDSDIEAIVSSSYKIEFPYYPFGICVEKSLRHQESLFTEEPYQLLMEGAVTRVPLIIGYNSNEAYVFVSMLKRNDITRKLSRDISLLLPEELRFVDEIELETAMGEIEGLYFKNNRTLGALLAFHRDAYFMSHLFRSAELHSSSAHPVYFYQYSHTSLLGVSSVAGVKKSGAAHSDELALLFLARQSFNDDDVIVQSNLVQLWTNFVKFLNPTPETTLPRWEPLSQREPKLLDIGLELEMKRFPHHQAAQLWNDIYHKYYYERNKV